MKHIKTFESFNISSDEMIEEGFISKGLEKIGLKLTPEKAIAKGRDVIFGDKDIPGWSLGKTWNKYDKRWVLNSAANTYKTKILPDIKSGKLPKEAEDKYFEYVGRNDTTGAKFFVDYDAENSKFVSAVGGKSGGMETGM